MGHATRSTPEAVKLLIRPALRRAGAGNRDADKSSARHEASPEKGHARDHQPTAQQKYTELRGESSQS